MGNDSGNNGNTSSFDDETPTEGLQCAHANNKGLLTFLGNDTLELKEHSRRVTSLYEAVRAIPVPVGPQLEAQVLDAYERHLTADTGNLNVLRAVLGHT